MLVLQTHSQLICIELTDILIPTFFIDRFHSVVVFNYVIAISSIIIALMECKELKMPRHFPQIDIIGVRRREIEMNRHLSESESLLTFHFDLYTIFFCSTTTVLLLHCIIEYIIVSRQLWPMYFSHTHTHTDKANDLCGPSCLGFFSLLLLLQELLFLEMASSSYQSKILNN